MKGRWVLLGECLGFEKIQNYVDYDHMEVAVLPLSQHVIAADMVVEALTILGKINYILM